MESGTAILYYTVSFFALLFGIYWGVVVGANIISKSNNNDKRQNILTRYQENHKKKKEEKQTLSELENIKPEKEPKLPKLPKLPKAPKLPKMKPKKKESLLDTRIASRESYTETQAYIDGSDVSSIVQRNQKNNVRQYDYMSRKREREQTEPELTLGATEEHPA
jgi:hypothetical protein